MRGLIDKMIIATVALALFSLGSSMPSPEVSFSRPQLPLVASDSHERPIFFFKGPNVTGPGCLNDGPYPGHLPTRFSGGWGRRWRPYLYNIFIAQPDMRVEPGKTEKLWCDMVIQYYEFADRNETVPSSKYRVRFDANGTYVWPCLPASNVLNALFKL
jgi:hypothetical protein